MSVLKAGADGLEAAGPTRVPIAAAPVTPIKAWAVVGAVFTAFILFVWIKWLSGPFATPVKQGPTPVPGWMSVNLVVWQVLMTGAMVGFLGWFLVRPLLRERRLTGEGIFCVAGFFLWFQDSLTNFFTPWITYNSHLVNIGSWYNDVPGWMSFGQPGRQLLEPPLLEPGVYVCLWLSVTTLGCTIMRRARRRWPQLGPYRLLGICFLSLAVFDFVLEGLVMMPLGLFTYVGAPFPVLFPSTYHTFPVSEPICASLMFTAATALRFYRNDRGEMLCERGVERVSGRLRQGLYRLLATIAATQLCFFVGYTLPVGILVTAHPRAWPADAQKRSYLTDFICGAGTDRACPGPAIPLSLGSRSAHVSPSGRLIVPPGTTIPRPVPFKR